MTDSLSPVETVYGAVTARLSGHPQVARDLIAEAPDLSAVATAGADVIAFLIHNAARAAGKDPLAFWRQTRLSPAFPQPHA